MELSSRVRWALRWTSLVASLAFLIVTNGQTSSSGVSVESDVTENDGVSIDDDQQTFGGPSNLRSRFLMLVSTLDGKVSALNVKNNGELMWSVAAGTESMLSSSITRLEYSNIDGVPTRLIPSLDGGLYQLDGKMVEPVPFNAETLLSSSFRYLEDSVIVGGKEYLTYGLDSMTGKVIYVCSIAGCQVYEENQISGSNEILVITRNTKTVRAVEMRSGNEKNVLNMTLCGGDLISGTDTTISCKWKLEISRRCGRHSKMGDLISGRQYDSLWNFSVAQHEIAFSASVPHDSLKTISREVDDDDEIGANFNIPTDDLWGGSELPLHDESDVELKVIIPKGIVQAVSKTDPKHIVWTHKFATPIANAWVLEDGKLSEVSLFDDRNVPALSAGDGTDKQEAMLYMGIHEKQLYVQPSVLFLREVERATSQAYSENNPSSVLMPRVKWRPYIATAPSRTPAVIRPRNPLQIEYEKQDDVSKDEHGISAWHDQYPFDNGYYLFSDSRSLRLDNQCPNNNSRQEKRITVEDSMSDTIWNWWKEIVFISIITSIVVHLGISRLSNKNVCPVLHKSGSCNKVTDDNSSKEQVTQLQKDDVCDSDKPEEKGTEYNSRYYNDFRQDSCLGRGGFGVVFEATNKIDDCAYAVKRISLHNSEKAKEKVMREVKALAKLDHSGIVRYYQAWFECPPPQWQEEKDKQLLDISSCSPSPGYTVTDCDKNTKTEENDSGNVRGSNERRSRTRSSLLGAIGWKFNPLKPFGGIANLTLDSEHVVNRKKGSTEEFSLLDDNVTFGNSSKKWDLDSDSNSCIIEFEDSQQSNSNSSVPFGNYAAGDASDKGKYSDDSFGIAFEDSGCGDNKSVNSSVEIKTTSTHSSSKSHSTQTGTINDTLSQCSSSLTSSASTIPCSKPSVIPLAPNRPNCLPLENKEEEEYNNKHTPTAKLYLYIQMQLCKKESLKEWLNANTLNRNRQTLLDIFDQLVSAVDYVHDSGLMHRDLKPSNIFFSMDGVVKIGDFGLVTALEEQCDPDTGLSARTPMYKHTDQVGTKLYMSPEQVDGKFYTHKVDIYALGLIFFELFFPFTTHMERVKTLLEVRQLTFPARFVRELRDEWAYVKPLLSHNPDQRPSTTDMLQHQLLKEFEEAKMMYNRVRTNSRSRTISTSSNNSTKPDEQRDRKKST